MSGSGAASAAAARSAALALSVEQLLGAGREEAAAALCRRWIEAVPLAERPHVVLAAVAEKRGDLAAALGHVEDALALVPSRIDLIVRRGALLRQLDEPGRAVDVLTDAVARAPLDPRANGHLGLALLDRGDPAAAVPHLERAHAAVPSEFAWTRSLAAALARSGAADRAAQVLDAALERHPDDADLASRRAHLALDLDDADGAIRWLARAAALDPESHVHAGKLVLLLLQAGRLAEGWASLRRRLEPPVRDARARLFPQPIWEGGSLAGRTIALWRQYGVGEEVMFASMLPDLLAEGGQAVVECDRRLRPLLQRSFPALRFAEFQGPTARPLPVMLDRRIDCKAAVADLGGRYRSSFDRFPSRTGYLLPDPARVARLAALQADPGRPRIGIAWRSDGAPASAAKSIPLAQWQPILSAIDATWIDLQHGATGDGRDEEARQAGVALVRVPDLDTRDDLDGLAALIGSLDLIVSISTATVHLAGAVGTPAFVMAPDRVGLLWHWFLGRSDSPWYPGVRLFRQGRARDWAGPVAAVAAALADWRRAGPWPS